MMVIHYRLHLVKTHLQFPTCWVGWLRIWRCSACTSTLSYDHLRRNYCFMVALLNGRHNCVGHLVRWSYGRWGSILVYFLLWQENLAEGCLYFASCHPLSWDSNFAMGHCLQLVAECIQALLPNILSGIDHSSIFWGLLELLLKMEQWSLVFPKLKICDQCHCSFDRSHPVVLYNMIK
jgi:hypothetical protein